MTRECRGVAGVVVEGGAGDGTRATWRRHWGMARAWAPGDVQMSGDAEQLQPALARLASATQHLSTPSRAQS